MSEEQLKAFLEAVRADPALRDQLKAVTDSDGILAIANAAGYVITSEELKTAHEHSLTDEELEAVVGAGNKGGPTCGGGTNVQCVTNRHQECG